jgi:hypothetical protein
MITEYDTFIVNAGITGVAYLTMLIREFPPHIFKQFTMDNPVDKMDDELQEIILNAGNNVEVW